MLHGSKKQVEVSSQNFTLESADNRIFQMSVITKESDQNHKISRRAGCSNPYRCAGAVTVLVRDRH